MRGVSTRRVDGLVEALGFEGISKSQASVMAKALDAEAAAFRTRPLDASPYPYLWLDALAVKVREEGRVVGVWAVVATAVSAEGRREILGLDLFTAEDGAAWTAFLCDLVARGLSGVRLVISDSHCGLTQAIQPVLEVPRSAMAERSRRATAAPQLDDLLVARLKELTQAHPTYGYRRLWALLRFRDGLLVNRKAVYRILKLKGRFCHERRHTPRPRARGWVSRAKESNERWALDMTHVLWGHLVAVTDCHDCESVGYKFSLRGRAKEAERALGNACLARFGTTRPRGATPVLRSDNGLVFQRRRFRAAMKDYRLRQEFITPYTPEQNGMIERFFRSLKEECVWEHVFAEFEEARREIRSWIE